jgi:hypothetical protein
MTNAYNISVAKDEILLGRLRCKWDGNIKMDLVTVY